MVTKRPHYVPQTYFRPWLGSDGLLAYRRRGTASAIPNSTRNIAVACGIYGMGEVSQAYEESFQLLENDWPGLRDELMAEGDLCSDRRRLFALFAAVQLVRTLKHSDRTNFISAVAATTTERPIPQDAVYKYLEKLDGDAPNEAEVYAAWTFVSGVPGIPTQSEALSISMDVAVDAIAPRLEARRWTVRKFRKPALMTNDCPVHLWSKPTKNARVGGIGVETADEVRFPLSSSALLVMTRPDEAHSNASARAVNAEICRQSHQFVVASPECSPSLDQLELAKHPPRLRFRLIDGPAGELLHTWVD